MTAEQHQLEAKPEQAKVEQPRTAFWFRGLVYLCAIGCSSMISVALRSYWFDIPDGGLDAMALLTGLLAAVGVGAASYAVEVRRNKRLLLVGLLLDALGTAVWFIAGQLANSPFQWSLSFVLLFAVPTLLLGGDSLLHPEQGRSIWRIVSGASLVLLAVAAVAVPLLAREVYSQRRAAEQAVLQQVLEHEIAGEQYAANKNYPAAVAEYNEAIRLLPNQPQHYSGRGRVYERWGKYDEAIADTQRATELWVSKYKEQANIWLDTGYSALARLYTKKGDYPQAIAQYSRAATLQPCNLKILLDRGDTYKAAGQREQAIADYRAAMRYGQPCDDPAGQQTVYYLGDERYDLDDKLRDLGVQP